MAKTRSKAKKKPKTKPRVPANKGKRLPPEPLTETEVKALLKGCSGRCPTGVRNKAMLALMYRAGPRVGETLALMLKDIDVEAGSLRILHGKGDKARLVGVDDTALALLSRWLDQRKALGLNAKHRVFCTLQGQPLKDSYVRALMKRLGVKAGIKKRCHPHGLRHSFAFETANEGTPLHLIQAQLGHADVSVTSKYISHLAPQQVVEAMRSRQWSL